MVMPLPPYRRRLPRPSPGVMAFAALLAWAVLMIVVVTYADAIDSARVCW